MIKPTPIIHNFGDAISPVIFEHLVGKKVANSYNVCNVFHRPTYFFIGSILDNLDTTHAIICGSGFIREDSRIFQSPAKILAVRGPLSRSIFLKHGIECPDSYGDPGLLIPLVYKNGIVKKQWDVGIIAHFIDKERVHKLQILPHGLTYTLIDIEDEFSTVIHNISASRYVLSSSLHGIIAAHAYGVPATWIQLSNEVIGHGFKFRDYFLSMGAAIIDAYKVNKILDLKKAINASRWYDPTSNQHNLLLQIEKLKRGIYSPSMVSVV